MLRYDLMKYILENSENFPIISNLGPTSDELWHLTKELEILPRERNFYTYGSMGLCSSIALGISINTKEKVISIDGDGSLLMNLGTLSTIGRISPKNLIIVVCDNEMWAQTGYQPTATAYNTDLEKVAKSCGFKNTFKCSDINEFKNTFSKSLNLSLIQIVWCATEGNCFFVPKNKTKITITKKQYLKKYDIPLT